MFASNNIDNGAPNGVNSIWMTKYRLIKIYNDDPNYSKSIYITVQSQKNVEDNQPEAQK